MKDRTTVHNGVTVHHHWTCSTFQVSNGMFSLTGWTFFVNGENYKTLPSAIEATEA